MLRAGSSFFLTKASGCCYSASWTAPLTCWASNMLPSWTTLAAPSLRRQHLVLFMLSFSVQLHSLPCKGCRLRGKHTDTFYNSIVTPHPTHTTWWFGLALGTFKIKSFWFLKVGSFSTFPFVPTETFLQRNSHYVPNVWISHPLPLTLCLQLNCDRKGKPSYSNLEHSTISFKLPT